MPCPHFDISIRSLGTNAPAVTGAAYISCSKLFSEYRGQTENYTYKQRELVHSEIMLPGNAPREYFDRQTLWNSVDMFEKQCTAQVARRIVMALPREIPMEQNIEMVREYCQKNFVDKGMCCDFAIHDPDPPGHNPHAHVMLTMRSIDEHGKWMPKCKKVYDLDQNGERIRLPSGRWKSHKENLHDWNDKGNAELWRESWEAIQNRYLERNDRTERVSLRSLEDQGIERQPTVHMGPAVTAMERKGIETNIGNLNREIREANRLIDKIRNMIGAFADWIAAVHEAMIEVREEEKNRPKAVYLGNLLQAKLELRQAQRSTWSHRAQSKCNLKDMEKILGYQVRKDNIVLYKGNRYRVPKGTYSPGKRVFMVVSDETVSITDTLTGEIYATHPLCHEKGKLIGQKRDDRDKSKSLQEQECLIQQLFQKDELVSPFLEHIHQAKPRYYRDQLGVIRKLFEEWDVELLIQGLHYCSEKELYSAGELKSSIIYLDQLKTAPKKKENLTALPSKYRGNTPEIRNLGVYEQAMERSVVNG